MHAGGKGSKHEEKVGGKEMMSGGGGEVSEGIECRGSRTHANML